MELMASDTYRIFCKRQLHNQHHQILKLLYQPIIGASAVSFYDTLWAEMKSNHQVILLNTHYRLTLLSTYDIKMIEEMRSKLEAIGLLNSYVKETSDHYEYLYELLLPLSPESFFANDLLNILLFHSLGELDYEKTKYCFQLPSILTNDYSDVTKKFSEVFDIHLDKNSINHTVLKRKINQEQQHNAIHLTYNMELFYTGLREFQIKKKSITKDVEELIQQLGSVYDISPLEMRSLVKESMNGDIVDKEHLRNVTKRYYEFEANGNFVKIHENQPTKHKVVKSNDSRSKKIAQLEALSPYQMLKSLQGNQSEPSLRDLNVVESLMTRQKLEAGVVNVIIETVTMLNNGELPRAHVEAIGGTFARKKIKTVEKALEEAKNYVRRINKDDEEELQIESKPKEEKETRHKINPKEEMDIETIKALLPNLYGK